MWEVLMRDADLKREDTPVDIYIWRCLLNDNDTKTRDRMRYQHFGVNQFIKDIDT